MPARAESGSQTLARGLAALALIGEADEPVSVRMLAEHLSIHRSMAYRLIRTLEQFNFVERTGAGELTVGARLVGIARNAARDVQSAALPVLMELADELSMTAFLVAFDGAEAVTLVSAEPRHAGAVIGQRPGTRHPIDRGAPGRVIRSQLDPERFPPTRFELTHDEVLAGISALSVPLTGTTRAMALAVLTTSGAPLDAEAVAARLERAATEIALALP